MPIAMPVLASARTANLASSLSFFAVLCSAARAFASRVPSGLSPPRFW
jgi:hypothetical protein